MRLRAARWIVSLGLLALLAVTTTPSRAAEVRDFDVSNGHYYEQAAPIMGQGFLVSDDDGVPLWRELQRLGGTQALGYPISRRYGCDEAVCQAFQRAVFKWVPGAREVELLDVFDWLHLAGKDAWLDERWGVPPWNSPDAPPKTRSREEDQAAQRAMIEANPLVETAYDRLGPLTPAVYGTARAYRVTATQATLRTQRAVFVQPADAPGDVQVLPAGSVFADAGLVPTEALVPVPAPAPLDDTPPVRISIAELGINAAVIPMDMEADKTLPVPSDGQEVAWYSYGARLGEEGNAVLAGHIDWNRARGVFWSLRDAQPGQTITLVSSAGHVYDYRVDWARTFPEDAPDGLQALGSFVGGTTITLVTCTGRFDAQIRSYLDRHIVRATLIARHGLKPAP